MQILFRLSDLSQDRYPGGIINSAMEEWCQLNLKNLKTIDIGEGIYYLQEDIPNLIGSELVK